MDRTRQPADDRYGHFSFAVLRPLVRVPAIRLVILASLVVACSVAQAQAPTGGIQDVYEARARRGQAALYGILQQLPAPPPGVAVPQSWRDGTLLRVLITAGSRSPSQPNDLACRQCAAQHFFLVPPQFPTGANRKLRAMRYAPGRVTYLDVKGKEYALFHIRVRRTEDDLRLTGATLMRTGFVPPILKKRIRLQFDAPLPAGASRDGIVARALAETGESMPDTR